MTLTSVATPPVAPADLHALGALSRSLTVPAGPGFTPDSLLDVLASFPALRSSQDRLSSSSRYGVGLAHREGRTFTVQLGPGLVALAGHDAARRERTTDRQACSRRRDVDLALRRWVDVGLTPNGDGPPSRSVSEWSRKSRARMLRGFAAVDWSQLARPGTVLAMVTLTYPGAWESVVPSGRAAKRHLANFRRRWSRALGWRLDGAWKLEFQRRGAPHFHLLVPVPATVQGERFEAWLSRTWADVVGHPDPVQRMRHEQAGTGVDFAKTGRFTDPRRCAIYFMKHGTKTHDDKEYQHNVPPLWQLPGMGPGRFWGFWGMPSAARDLELDLEDFVLARRVCRKVMKARSRRSGRVPRTFGAGGQLTGGWLLLNDGLAFGHDLARYLVMRRLT